MPLNSGIGAAVVRKEDLRLLTGRGCCTDGVNLQGQVYAAMVRSPHAHARIGTIDTAEAMRVPGVLAVFTGADVLADGLQPMPQRPKRRSLAPRMWPAFKPGFSA